MKISNTDPTSRKSKGNSWRIANSQDREIEDKESGWSVSLLSIWISYIDVDYSDFFNRSPKGRNKRANKEEISRQLTLGRREASIPLSLSLSLPWLHCELSSQEHQIDVATEISGQDLSIRHIPLLGELRARCRSACTSDIRWVAASRLRYSK